MNPGLVPGFFCARKRESDGTRVERFAYRPVQHRIGLRPSFKAEVLPVRRFDSQ
jgi:hypothetical protein